MDNIQYPGLLKQLIAPLVGILIAITLSFLLTPRIIRLATIDIDNDPPKGVTKADWNSITNTPKRGGAVLGLLETTLFFIAFWITVPELIAGWLVFKVGSKWEIWSNLIKVPEELKGADEIKYLAARHQWGTKVLVSFLVGTITNILIAIVCTLISYGIQQI